MGGGGGNAAGDRRGGSTEPTPFHTPSSSVRGDAVEVPQSRAVDGAREALAAEPQPPGASANSGMSSSYATALGSSPGRAPGSAAANAPDSPAVPGSSGGGPAAGRTSGDRERRKSVKFAAGGPSPGVERRR